MNLDNPDGFHRTRVNPGTLENNNGIPTLCADTRYNGFYNYFWFKI